MIRTTLHASAILLLLMTALAAEPEVTAYSPMQAIGTIDDRRIVEASGLARSHRVPDRLWALNDGGSGPQLFAFGIDGKAHGSILLNDAANVDWEDLASFEHDDRAWLLVADIGDNEARRPYCTLYLVEEPLHLQNQRLEPIHEVRFRYPEGPLDAEAIAVDAASGSILVLVKRTVPARLYRIALIANDDTPQLAELLGEVASLPQPTARDLERALPDKIWHWQPTAMDISHSGETVMILTYRGAYLFPRHTGEDWIDALQRPPVPLDLGGIALAEAAAFGYKDRSIFVTVEGRRPMLYRYDRRP